MRSGARLEREPTCVMAPPALTTVDTPPLGHIRSLTEGSITRSLLELTAPILFVTLLQSLSISINSIWVGHYLGEAALTATSNANLVLFLLIGVAFGISMAATILVGQRVGANDIPGARNVVGTSAALFVGSSVLIAALGLTFSPLILKAMNTPVPSLPSAIQYMRVVFLALPPLYLYALVVGVLRAVGDSKTPFWFMLLSLPLDIAFNPIFIFGLGPAPRLGVAGSALASLTAQTVSLVAMLIHLYRHSHRHLLCLTYEDLHTLKIDPSLVKVLVCKGIPMSGQVLVLSLSGVLMISIVNRVGIDATAAFGASLQLWNYVQMPAIAVGQSVSAMAAQNIGAGKWDRLNSITAAGILLSLISTGAIVILLEAMGKHAFAPFLPTHSAALTLAAHLNSIASSSYFLIAIPTVLFAVVRASGAVIVPLAIMTTSLLLVRYPSAEVFYGHFGPDAIWWSFPLSAAFAAVLAVLHYRLADWR